MNVKQTAFAAFAALAMAATAQSQDVYGGFQITVSKPLSDLDKMLDGKLGAGIGAHLLIDLGKGHAIVPRVDYVTYKRTESGDAFVLKGKYLTMGADYNYYFSGKANKGLYATVGAAYTSGKLELTAPVDGFSERRSTIGASAGAGYMFMANLGVELKYNYVKFKAGGEDVKTPSIAASLIIRF